jgi:hypothetical protein
MRLPARSLKFILMIIILLASITACEKKYGPPEAIQAYLKALVARDTDQISTLACSDWEASARTDLEAFTAVTISLQDVSCKETGSDNEVTLVSCTGKIIANYGNEVQEIDLSGRSYRAVFEGGEWRMCGYQ